MQSGASQHGNTAAVHTGVVELVAAEQTGSVHVLEMWLASRQGDACSRGEDEQGRHSGQSAAVGQSIDEPAALQQTYSTQTLAVPRGATEQVARGEPRFRTIQGDSEREPRLILRQVYDCGKMRGRTVEDRRWERRAANI